MKVLLTGGAGYIGTHIAVELCESGHSVVIVDNLSNSSKESIKAVENITNCKISFYKSDCRDRRALSKVFRKECPDAVIHLAGLKSVAESVDNPIKYWKNNIDSTLALIDVMADFNCKELIFSSSATVYGPPKTLPVSERCRTGVGIANPYGETKYVIERILNNLAESDKSWKITILRYFNPVGAHESGLIGESPNDKPNNLMPYITRVAIGKLPHLNVFGDSYRTVDGTGVRDYIHVVDLANGHVKALEREAYSGIKTYNLGTGKGVSVLELVKSYERNTKAKIPYKIVAPRAGDVAVAYANPSKANRELKWKATYSIANACQTSHNWQTKNPDGFSRQNIMKDIYIKYTKRVLDIATSFVALVVLLIPMLAIAFFVKTTSKGPIIFKQTRIGKDNEPFTIYKFRTMRTDAPHDSSPYEFHDAHMYITKVGKVLRKTSLDELPQLINILKGNMSVVGPRPAGINDKERIKLRNDCGVHVIKPGLTGWAQINGRDEISESKKVEFDAEYSSNLCFFMDIKCILKTVVIVLNKYGNVEGGELAKIKDLEISSVSDSTGAM